MLPDMLHPASGHALVARAFDAFLPPPPLDVADWAAGNRWITGARAGRWDHAVAPYLTEPMRTLTSALHLTTCIVGPGQCGKTAVAENWLLASIDQDPAGLLWYMQTDDSLKAYVKDRINPMIEAHDAVRAKQGLRPVDDSLGYKRFQGMSAQFLVAARSNLINKSARRIVGDEWDAYDPDFGDPRVQLDTRRQSYGRDSMLLAMSHCDRAQGSDPALWTAGIMQLYADSDRRTWWWPCPHCNGWSSPNPGTGRVMALVYPDDAPLDEIQQAAALLCPLCGAEVPDAARRDMNMHGRWIGLGQHMDADGTVTGEPLHRDVAGFWIVGVMSPFLLAGIGGLARARAEAERLREKTGDDKTLREVIVKQWGFPYDPPRRVGSVEVATLVERADPTLQLGRVAAGVRFVTVGIDVQGNRFELLARGWGVGAESWVIDHRVIEAQPATSADDWTAMLDMALALEWPLADGSGRVMRPRCIAVDSGGEAGVTEQAYAAWRRLRLARRVRNTGIVSGREAWTLVLTMGASTLSAPRLAVTYPDTSRKDRRAGARGEVPLARFNPNSFKDALAAQLGVAEAGAGCVHLPHALLSPEPPHAFLEQLCAEQRRPNGAWVKATPGARNEALDLMVLTHVGAHLHGLARMDWSQPRPWAMEWDRNALVGRPAAIEPPAPRAALPGPSVAPARPTPLADPARRSSVLARLG